MKCIKIISLVCLFLFIGMQSCKKDHGTPPDLPPQTSFLADFSDFNETKLNVEKTNVNWVHSVVNVGVWNLLITVGLAIPVASYIEALKNHEAEYQSDNTWLWQYSFTIGTASFTAKLYGTINTGNVGWEMHISKAGEYNDFLWYSGTSNLDGMSGDWILYNKPTDPTELLRIDWVRTTNETGHIKYMNVVPGGAENGGYILYGNDSDTDLESYYDIYNKGADNLTEIEWKKADLSGRVKDPNKFVDADWHCWDATQLDVNCVVK